MMSTVRRRSRDVATLTPGDEDSETPSHGKRLETRRKTFVALFVLSTILFALILISYEKPAAPWSYLSTFLWQKHEHESSNLGNSFELSPAKHVLRPPTTITQQWHITSGYARPDGVLKRIYLVNGAFPGPTLEARPGDRLVIRVVNGLDEEKLSIHWHGLSMRGANHMDGAAGITQDPIPSGKVFTYDFVIDDQHGTFWWHAHSGVQRADGLYGGLVIHEPADGLPSPDGAAKEFLLLIGDWYHRSAQEALEYYMHPGAFGLETIPDSLLVNGAGSFQCSDAVPARPVDCSQVDLRALPALNLNVDARNILRIVNVGAYAGFSIAVPGALLIALEIDGGHEVDGSNSKAIGFIHPGERVKALIQLDLVVADNHSDLQITFDDQYFKYENPALTVKHEFPVRWNGDITARTKPQGPTYENFDIQDVKSAQDQTSILPLHADRTIVLYTLTQKMASRENVPHGFINRTTWLPHSPPLIDLPRTMWKDDQFVPLFEYDARSPLWVDIVLNNLDEDWHPFHLHGYDFWVLSKFSSEFNWGSFNPFENAEPLGGKYDVSRAVKRDTFYVPRRGYAVLRFRADNPGLWMFHCHVLWHQASGMAMSFEVR